MDWSYNYSLIFGIGGSIITISAIVIFWGISKESMIKPKKSIFIDFGFFFLVMAAYNLCPFCGVKCFALQPDKMIK
jgi:hypothetical protein